MTNADLRSYSLKQAAELGYRTNPDLPLLESDLSYRPTDDIVNRCLSLYVVVASSFGLSETDGRAWLEAEGLWASVSSMEREYLLSGINYETSCQNRVECLQAFAWLLRFTDSLDFDKYCEDGLVAFFPDIRGNATAQAFRSASRLRNQAEALQALDLAYCLHWSVVEQALNRDSDPQTIEPYVIVERRRALEWAPGTAEWDEVSLDT